MIKKLNSLNLRIVWRWLFGFKHGHHPDKEAAIYEYWQVGPVELQSFSRKSEPVEYLDIDLFRSSDKQTCGRCGVAITPENDSGWEVFVGDGTLTQPECKGCETIGYADEMKAR